MVGLRISGSVVILWFVVGGCLKRSFIHERYIVVVDRRNKHCYCYFSRVITEEFDIWIDIGVKVDKSKGKHMDDWWFGVDAMV